MPESRPARPEPAIVRTVAELRAALSEFRKGGLSIGLVPTMGALHEGHRSLVEHGKRQCARTVVSIFVNPSQFGPGEDYARYPRPVDRDLEMLASAGADLVFLPEVETIYPEGCTTTVDPPEVSRRLEGQFRPGHFRGVATVVLKLFHLVQPARAFFGQKDYQQCAVIRHMIRDLNVPVELVVCPTVRENDGLALSSRNVYLSPAERAIALSLSRTLARAGDLIRDGEKDARAIMAGMVQQLIEEGVTSIDYAVVADPETLEVLDRVRTPAVLLIAAFVGSTRLIDNLIAGDDAQPNREA